MEPSFGTYYPWQFVKSIPDRSEFSVYELTSARDVHINLESGPFICLIYDGNFQMEGSAKMINHDAYYSVLVTNYKQPGNLKITASKVLAVQFDLNYILLSYPPELLNLYSRWKDLEEKQHLQLTKEDFQFCSHNMQGIKLANDTHAEHREYYLMRILDLLIIKIHESSRVMEQYTDEKRRAKSLMFDYLGLVRLHFRDNWTMEQYARELLVSKDYLHQLCSRHLGKTPTEVISDKQAIEAQILLKNTSLTVKEIAHRLNFEDQNYFTRFFTKKIGLAPTEFRNKVKVMITSSDLDHTG